MKKKGINNTKVGILVLAGGLFLIFSLYMIGQNRNLFGSSFTVNALVDNANGLVPGNNVRFMGIDVGTVRSISIANDTAIFVSMSINSKMKPYIKKNAVVATGTDGLMGNRLVNIQPQPGPAAGIEDGDLIRSFKSLDPDEMLRTLHNTNDNIERITANFYDISRKLNNSMSLWEFLADTSLTGDLRQAIVDMRKAGSHTAEMTLAAKELTARFEQGDGLANALFTDTMLVHRLSGSLQGIEHSSQQASLMVQDFRSILEEMEQGKGTAGMLFSDSLLRNSLLQTSFNLEEGTDLFSRNMKALQHNFLFRRYFRKLGKQQQDSPQE